MATALLTALAMLPLAGNSILCRLALGQGLIDAASFTTIRVASGAALLAAIVYLKRRPSAPPRRAGWAAPTMLFGYMACFSFAYRSLGAGTGALILFGAVQLTMILQATRSGETLSPGAWTGSLLAAAGLGWLVFPGLTAPDPVGALLMALAGIAWGVYSLLGRSHAGGGDAVARTAQNFVLATPMAVALSLALLGRTDIDATGAALAIASGTLTSGLGYVMWYAVLPRLTATVAASVQLTVPIIAAALGVLLLGESLTPRLLLAAVAVLGGVGLVVATRRPHGNPGRS
jgi:drug/metabolite transporter (DMT)-like permease